MQVSFLTQSFNNTLSKTDSIEKSDNVSSKAREKSLQSEPVQADKLPVQADKLKNLQNSLTEHNIILKFRQDEKTKQLVVELVNDKTGDSIRQFPSEVSLKLSAMSIKIQGQFVDNKV